MSRAVWHVRTQGDTALTVLVADKLIQNDQWSNFYNSGDLVASFHNSGVVSIIRDKS